MIGPAGRPPQSWRTILVDSRTSWRRTQHRAKLSPSGWVTTFQSACFQARGDWASRRRSQSTPDERMLAPVRPYSRATSAGMTPTPRVRCWKMVPPIIRSSTSSQKSSTRCMQPTVSSSQPFGRSSFSPPMRSKLGWKRPPVADSIRFRTCSRSRKARNTGVMAPSWVPTSPRNRMRLAWRPSSKKMVRIHWARSGASTPISCSAARMNGTSLQKLPSQSMRLTSVVIWG